jgi:hypothetical protein
VCGKSLRGHIQISNGDYQQKQKLKNLLSCVGVSKGSPDLHPVLLLVPWGSPGIGQNEAFVVENQGLVYFNHFLVSFLK